MIPIASVVSVDNIPVKVEVIPPLPPHFPADNMNQPGYLHNFIQSQEINKPAAIEYLSRHSWPIGLQETLFNNISICPIRFVIIDDSGSMSESVI